MDKAWDLTGSRMSRKQMTTPPKTPEALFVVGDAVTIIKGKNANCSSQVIEVSVKSNNRKYDSASGQWGVHYYAYKLKDFPGWFKEDNLERFAIDPEEVDETVQSLHNLLADLQESMVDE